MAEPRTAGAERGREPARTTARNRPVDRHFPVSGAVDRSRGRHAGPPRLPDRGPQIQRDVIVRDKPSDNGREEKRGSDDITRDGGKVVVDLDASDDDGKRGAVVDEHDSGAGDSDASERDDTADDERDDNTRQDVEPDADVPDQRHDVDEPDRDDASEPRDGSEEGQQRTSDVALASPRDRDEHPDRGGSDGDDGDRSEDRTDKEDADERDRAGSDDHDDDLDESDEADEGQADQSDDDGGSEGRHRASD